MPLNANTVPDAFLCKIMNVSIKFVGTGVPCPFEKIKIQPFSKFAHKL